MCFERLVNIQRNPCTRYVVTTYIISTYFVRTRPEEQYLSRQIYRYLVNHVPLYLICTFSVFPFPPFWEAYLHYDIYFYVNRICRYEKIFRQDQKQNLSSSILGTFTELISMIFIFFIILRKNACHFFLRTGDNKESNAKHSTHCTAALIVMVQFITSLHKIIKDYDSVSATCQQYGSVLLFTEIQTTDKFCITYLLSRCRLCDSSPRPRLRSSRLHLLPPPLLLSVFFTF